MAAPMASDKLVDDRISVIAGDLGDDDDFNHKELPGLRSLLDDYLDPDIEVDRIHFTRRLLKVFSVRRLCWPKETGRKMSTERCGTEW